MYKKQLLLTAPIATAFLVANFFVASAPASAAIGGTLHISGVTAPAGTVEMGTHLWISDHTLGFCRLDAATPGLTGDLAINAGTCILGDGVTGPASVGQPSFDPVRNLVYVPDNSNKGVGAWRLTFDPATQTVGKLALLDTAGIPLHANPTATAIDKSGNLYIGFVQSSVIVKISNPGIGKGTANASFGTALGGRGVSGLTMVGSDLYLSEKTSITKITPAGGTADPVTGITVDPINGFGPTAITSRGNVLFFADTPLPNGISTISSFDVSTSTETLVATTGTLPNATTDNFLNVSGLFLDKAGNLLVSDDPTAGAGVAQGRMWSVAGVAPAIALASIQISPAAANFSIGQTQAMTAAGLDQFGAPIAAAVAWTSSNPAVGTINSATGAFSAIKAGTTILTATSAAISKTITVKVLASASGAVQGDIAITGTTVSKKTRTSATITFTTDFPSIGKVKIGTAKTPKGLITGGVKIKADNVEGTTHAIVLTNLKKNHRYFFQVTVTHADGTSVTKSLIKTFATRK